MRLLLDVITKMGGKPNMKQYSVRQLTLAAMIGALYAVLTLVIAPFGGAYSPIQCRISEALCICNSVI